MSASPHFLLVGNGPYTNRGCEAIVRGTMAILRREFGEDFRVTLGTFDLPGRVARQAAAESDPLVRHVALGGSVRRWTWPWWKRQLLDRWIEPRISTPERRYAMLDGAAADAACALHAGGDNFTLDYGRPTAFLALDEYFQRRGVPTMLWGASVGPFEADPEFAPAMFAQLRAMRAIFVRESVSYDYLAEHGFSDRLHRMSDPAFAMAPVEPPPEKIGCALPPEAVGMNFSPLMARYAAGGDLRAWIGIAAEIVLAVVEATGRDAILVPHVTCPHPDDHARLREVAAACAGRPAGRRVVCLGDALTAAETKWVIARCAAFVGARTHATIAAISSEVPTLSLAYSRKAKGLNEDIFGGQDYCLQPAEITPAGVAERVVDLLDHRDAIRRRLAAALPNIRDNAFRAGALLRRVIEEP